MTASASPATVVPTGSALERPQLALRRPDLLPRLVGVTVALAPLLVPAGPGNTALADVALLATLVVALLWVSRDDIPLRLPYGPAIGLMMIGGLLGALSSDAPLDAVVPVVQDAVLLLWAAVLSLGRDHGAIVSAATRAWCTIAGWYALVMVLAYVLGSNQIAGVMAENGARAAYTFPDPNLAGNWLVVSFFMMRACCRPRNPLLRVAALSLVVVAVVFTGSNGALVTLVLGVVLAFGLERMRTQGLVGALAVLVLASAAVIAAVGYIAPRADLTAVRESASASIPLVRDSVGRSGQSGGEREQLLVEGVRLWLSGDATGVGPAQTKATLSRSQAPYVKEAHNDYLATLLERGVVGAAGLVLLLATVLLRCARLASGEVPLRHRASVPRAELLVAVLPVMVAGALFYEVLHFRHLWTWLGLLAALEAGRGSQEASAAA